MKRHTLLTMAVAALLVATTANAFIVINWQSYPLKAHDDSTYLNGTLIQLVWSLDLQMDPIVGGATPVDDDILLDSSLIGVPSALPPGMGGFNAQTYYYTDLEGNGTGSLVDDTTFQSGHVYVRFFDSAAPDETSWYHEGGFTPTLNSSPANPNDYNEANVGGTYTDMPLVPEPGTLALFGVGALAIAWSRRRRNAAARRT